MSSYYDAQRPGAAAVTMSSSNRATEGRWGAPVSARKPSPASRRQPSGDRYVSPYSLRMERAPSAASATQLRSTHHYSAAPDTPNASIIETSPTAAAFATTPMMSHLEASDRESELQSQLLYTQDVLKKYRSYVETRLMGQLTSHQKIAESLQAEVGRLKRERDTLELECAASRKELEVTTKAASESAAKHQQDLQALAASHAEQLSQSERRHMAEMQEARDAVVFLQRESSEMSALQATLTKRDDEIRKLRQSLAESASKFARIHGDATASLDTAGVIKELSVKLDDFYVTLRSAIMQQLQQTTMLGEGSGAGVITEPMARLPRLASGAASNSSSLVEANHFSEMLDVMQREVIGMVKLLLQAHAAAVDQYEGAVHDLERERDMFSRRIDEIEDDRKAERDALQQKIDMSHVRHAVTQASAAHLLHIEEVGGDHRGIIGAAELVQRSAAAAASSPRRIRKIGVGVQTTLDMTLFGAASAQSTNSGPTADDAAALHQRVLAEVQRLQSENTSLREAVYLLDQQRQRFIGFVNNDAVTDYIVATLGDSALEM